ncbi:ethanolamine utilization protein, partial [Paraphaeosphaeria sporulosa]
SEAFYLWKLEEYRLTYYKCHKEPFPSLSSKAQVMNTYLFLRARVQSSQTSTPPYSVRTETKDNPSYLTSGFYRIQPGPTRNIPSYTYEETKYVLSGQIDVLDEATGVTHHLVPGDFAFFHVGTKCQFSSKSGGLAFFAVTRPIITQHPGLQGREEKIASKL